MVLNEIKDRIEEEMTDEEIINYRLRKTTRLIEEELDKNENKDMGIDPYFDSIKKWRPI
jgi:hypothetical protein